MEPSDAETCKHVSISEANKSDPFRGMTRKASAARMSILILIAEPQQSNPVRGMTRKGIKREVTCELTFDTRSSQAPLGE